jgi:hypothetical protein
MRLYWGDSLFFLVPIAVASFLPMMLVTRRAIVVSVWVADVITFAQLFGAPVYLWARFRIMHEDGLYRPFSEAAVEITRTWRELFHSLLPIVAGHFDITCRSRSTVPTIKKCSPISIRLIRPGSTFPTGSFTKGMSAFASMKAPFLTPPADSTSPRSIPMRGISKSRSNGGPTGWPRRH